MLGCGYGFPVTAVGSLGIGSAGTEEATTLDAFCAENLSLMAGRLFRESSFAVLSGSET